MVEAFALSNDPSAPPEGDVSFINNLPPELLSRIFEVGCEDDNEDKDSMAVVICDEEDQAEDGDDSESDVSTKSSDNLPSFPIIVSLVCRHWRDVAFLTPSLWTMIVVPPIARPPYALQSTLLERSKNLPIDIHVNYGPHDHEEGDEPTYDNVKFLFSMLVPHIHRWRTMNVFASHERLMFPLFMALSDLSITAVPKLLTLELRYGNGCDYVYSMMSKHCSFSGSAPLLTKLVLRGVHVDWNQPWIASASNLTDLELSFHAEAARPSWAQFAAILRGASALEKLNLRLSGPFGDPWEWFVDPATGGPLGVDTPISLPRVTDFVLAFHTPVRAIGLIRMLHLPALKNLALNFDMGDYTGFINELARPVPLFQKRPRSMLAGLVTLKIEGLPCSIEGIGTLYRELWNLTSLNLSLSWCLSPFFLDVLCTPYTSARRRRRFSLPRLVKLYVYGTSGSALRMLVKNRRDAGIPLNSLYVDKHSDVDMEDLVWLKENVETFHFFERIYGK